MKRVPVRLSVFLPGIAKKKVWFRTVLVAGAVLSGGLSGIAQTTVTTTGSGTTNKIPKFTGSSTIGDSAAITEVNGNVGIGTTSPLMSTPHLVS